MDERLVYNGEIMEIRMKVSVNGGVLVSEDETVVKVIKVLFGVSSSDEE